MEIYILFAIYIDVNKNMLHELHYIYLIFSSSLEGRYIDVLYLSFGLYIASNVLLNFVNKQKESSPVDG